MISSKNPQETMLKKTILTSLLLVFTFLNPAYASLSYSGSSTIGENIISKAARIFTAKTGIKFSSIENPGSGKGLELLAAGKVNLTGVSRLLTAEEKKQKFYYQIIGYDAIGVFVHKNNPVKNLSRDEVKKIFTGEIKNWKEVGGKDAPIACITETWGDQRATMIEFQRLAMEGAEYRKDRVEADSPKDQAIRLTLEENGVIAVSLAFTLPGIKLVSIENILPAKDNVQSGIYLFARPLYLLSKGLPKAEIKKFFDFIISAEGQKIVAENFSAVR